jgi:hypothetical protein
MDADTIDYAALIQDALRGMVRRVLDQVVEHGLPGEHHFYIGFRTDHPEVRLSGFLRDQNPEEMRIILQHQFWDLEVDEVAFSVSLSFGGSRQRLTVPFTALTEFADPAAGVALRFEARPSATEEPDEPALEEPEPEEPPPGGSVIRFPSRPKERPR